MTEYANPSPLSGAMPGNSGSSFSLATGNGLSAAPAPTVVAETMTPSFNLGATPVSPNYDTVTPQEQIVATQPTAQPNTFNLSSSNSEPVLTGMTNNQNEQNVWGAAPENHVVAVEPYQMQPLVTAPPNNGFSLSTNNQPAVQVPFQNPTIAAVPAPVEPMVARNVTPVGDFATPGNSLASSTSTSGGSFTLSSQTQPTQLQPAQSQPLATNTTPAIPATLPNMTQESIVGIVSPSQLAATPTAVSNTEPLQAYSLQAQPLQAMASIPQQQQLTSQTIAAQPLANDQYSVYIVQQGDSIYNIAKQELGNVRRYREVYDLNRDRLPIGQDTLTAGMELLLPVVQ
jgi:nucleoid-associated protein YgaU